MKTNEKNSINYTSEQVLTIDATDTKDREGAICVQKTLYGYRLQVPVADVSSFVQHGSELDKIAERRSTSVYLPNVTYPMLPPILSENLCSLNKNKLRNTISVIMKINNKGKLLDTEITKGRIRSRVEGVYSEINRLLANDSDELIMKKYKDVYQDLPHMVSLYKALRAARKQRGSITNNTNRPRISISEDCLTLIPVKRGLAENLIEEYMIICNYAVAVFMREHHLPVIYRVQEEKNKMASYTPSRIHHADLMLDHYLHFTSPIRRVADLKNHQILSMFLKGYSSVEIHKAFDEELPEICESATRRMRTAKQIQDSCFKLCCLLFFSQHPNEEYVGIIVGFDKKNNPLLQVSEYEISIVCCSTRRISIGEQFRFT